MTGSKKLLLNFKESSGPNVTFGYNSHGITMGVGNIVRGNVYVRDVSYVQGLKYNFLSINQFCDRGFKVEFTSNLCLIRDSHTGLVKITGS